MNSVEGLRDLEQLFSGYSELKAAAPQFLQNKLTPKFLKDSVKSIKDIDAIAASVKLTLAQKTQLKSILFPTDIQTAPQSSVSSQGNSVTSKSTVDSSLQPTVLKPEGAEEVKAESGDDKKKKKKKLPAVIINTSRSRGELKLIKAIIEKNKVFGWKEATGLNGHIMWSGLDIPWEDTYIAKEIRLNRIPGMKNLSHKKMTGFYLNKFREYYPEEFDFYPRTFLIPEELDTFRAYKEQHPDKLFIAKPTSGSQGDGIILVKKFSDLPLSSYTSNEMVVQEYLDKPLLHDGKKFDLRIYVLVSSVKPMLGFLNEEGLARFCTEDYQPPTKDNLKNSYMHLTNYSLNKLSNNYKYTEECEEINDGSKRTLTSLWKGLEKQGVSREEIIGNIKPLLQRLLVSLQPIIQFNYNAAFEGKDDGKCFHVLGVDILVDENLKPWLLEINANPSLSIGYDDHADPKAKEIISPVDKYVKEKVLEDALMIVRKSIEKQSDIDKYRTYELIYDSEKGEFSQMDLFKDILEVFGKLSGVRFKTHMTSAKFRKLANIAGMTNDKLMKPHYDIIYQKLVKGSDDNQMNFSVFIQAIEEITSMLKKGDYDPDNKRSFIEEVVSTIKLGL